MQEVKRSCRSRIWISISRIFWKSRCYIRIWINNVIRTMVRR